MASFSLNSSVDGVFRFNPADPENPAYWMPVPSDYLLAVGAVSAQWGYFEMQFEGLMQILLRNPEAAKRAGKISSAFGDRPKQLRRMARICFPGSPTLVEKICDFTTRAADAGQKRNAIVHGFWFDMSHFGDGRGVTLMTEPDGTGDFFTVTKDEIEKLAQKISALKTVGISLIFPPFGDAPHLAPDELAALQVHHTNHPAPSHPIPIFRPPGRKGTPKQPEPFLA